MIIKLAWKNIWRNKLRSFIMIGAMVFGLMGMMLMVGFVNAMLDNMVENAIKYQTGHLQVHNPEFVTNEDLNSWLPNADALGQNIKSLSGIAGVTVRQVADGMIGSAKASRGVRINGIYPSEESAVTDISNTIKEGADLPPDGRNPILVSERLKSKLSLRLHSKVVMTLTNVGGDVSGAAFRVCGFYKTPNSNFDESNVFVRRNDLATLTGMTEAHEIAVRVTDEAALPAIQTNLKKMAGPDALVQNWQEVEPLLATMVSSMDVSNAIVIAVFVIALGFGIVNIMLMAVYERTREFGVLMAIGMTKFKILKLIALESFFLGAVGSAAGMTASTVLILIIGWVGLPLGKMAEGLGSYGMDTVLYPSVHFDQYLWTVLVILGASVLASLYPTRLIIKKQPHEAMEEK